jgi:hypothetical protein
MRPGSALNMLSARMNSRMPPPTCSEAIEMPKIPSRPWPNSAAAPITIAVATAAVLIVLWRSRADCPAVRLRNIGIAPNGLISASRVMKTFSVSMFSVSGGHDAGDAARASAGA